MRLFTIGISILLASCSGSETYTIEGAWQSDRDLTLADLRESREFTEKQWAFLSDPAFFGSMVQVYRGESAVVVFDGQCSPVTTFEIVRSEENLVSIRFSDEFFEEERTVDLTTAADRLYVPIALLEGDLRETFTRISPAEAARQYPCLRSFVEGFRESA
jgi:hypothetical protein